MNDDIYRDKLSAQEFHVLRESGTERPFTGEYWDHDAVGDYHCRACGALLFSSDTKFDAQCGWPSFFRPAEGSQVTYIKDVSMGMERVEVRCSSCDSHLGHVFEGEGFGTPTDLRYCINSLSMRFRAPAESNQDDDDAEAAAPSSRSPEETP